MDMFEHIIRPSVPVLSAQQVADMLRYADECRKRVIARGEEPPRITAPILKPAIPVRA